MIFSVLLIMFFKHPTQVCMSYKEHFMFSLRISGIFALASIQALIHAVNPDCFIMSTTENMKRIQEMLETVGCGDQSSEL